MAERRWTLTAQLRPRGAEGYPVVTAGPPIPLYTTVDVIAAEVTDEMVERAAISLRNHEAEDRSGLPPVDSLDQLLEPDYYRDMARAALTAALHWKQQPEEGTR